MCSDFPNYTALCHWHDQHFGSGLREKTRKAIATFAAQNYGKGSIERVREGCLFITVLISLGLTALTFLFWRFFMGLFIDPSEPPDDPAGGGIRREVL